MESLNHIKARPETTNNPRGWRLYECQMIRHNKQHEQWHFSVKFCSFVVITQAEIDIYPTAVVIFLCFGYLSS